MAYDYDRTTRVAGLLRLGPGKAEVAVSRALAEAKKLRARSRGDLPGSVESAAHYAKKTGKPMFVFSGNSYGHAVWRVSYKPGDYLNSINNTGTVVYQVTPDLEVTRHDVKGRDDEPDA